MSTIWIPRVADLTSPLHLVHKRIYVEHWSHGEILAPNLVKLECGIVSGTVRCRPLFLKIDRLIPKEPLRLRAVNEVLIENLEETEHLTTVECEDYLQIRRGRGCVSTDASTLDISSGEIVIYHQVPQRVHTLYASSLKSLETINAYPGLVNLVIQLKELDTSHQVISHPTVEEIRLDWEGEIETLLEITNCPKLQRVYLCQGQSCLLRGLHLLYLGVGSILHPANPFMKIYDSRIIHGRIDFPKRLFL